MGIKESLGQLYQERTYSGYYERLNQGPTTTEALLTTGVGVAASALNIFAQAKQAGGDDGSDKTQSSSVATLQAENKKIFDKYEVSDLQGLKQKYDTEAPKYKSAENKLNEANAKLKTAQENYNNANQIYMDSSRIVVELETSLSAKTNELESTQDESAKAKIQSEINAIKKEIEEQKLEQKKAALDIADNILNGENGAVKAQATAQTEFDAIKETFTPLSNDYKQAAANQKQIDSLSGHVSEDTGNLSKARTLAKDFEALYDNPKASDDDVKKAADELIKFIDDNSDNNTIQSIKTLRPYKLAQDIVSGKPRVKQATSPEELQKRLSPGMGV